MFSFALSGFSYSPFFCLHPQAELKATGKNPQKSKNKWTINLNLISKLLCFWLQASYYSAAAVGDMKLNLNLIPKASLGPWNPTFCLYHNLQLCFTILWNMKLVNHSFRFPWVCSGCLSWNLHHLFFATLAVLSIQYFWVTVAMSRLY